MDSTASVVGTLTAYPSDIRAYEYAIQTGWFTPQKKEQVSAYFIATFSSASQEHDHFDTDEGKLRLAQEPELSRVTHLATG